MPKSSRIEAEHFFVVRVPCSPIETVRKLPSEKAARRAFLERWLSDPKAMEALYVASPSLVMRLEQWRKSPESKQGKKIESSLVKYLIRISTRPTPFGLFAGIAIGHLGASTKFSVDPSKSGRRVTRLDMHYLSQVRNGLSEAANAIFAVPLRPNPTIHQVTRSLHYIEPYQAGGEGDGTRQYRLSSAEADEPVVRMLDLAKKGATAAQLASAFCKFHPDLDKDEVLNFIAELAAEGLLLSDIPLTLTTPSPGQSFVQALQQEGYSEQARALTSTMAQLQAIDARSVNGIGDYDEAKSPLQRLPYKINDSKLFQVDLHRHLDACSIGTDLTYKIAQQVALLARISKRQTSTFSDFKTRFQQRFEGQMVPLLNLLNEEAGISYTDEGGYESPLLAGMKMARHLQAHSGGQEQLSPLQLKVLETVSLPSNAGKAVVRMDGKSFNGFLKENSQQEHTGLPASFAASLALYRDPETSEPIVHYKGAYGPSAANLLGRFCHLDEGLTKAVKNHVKREENQSPEAVFAEVVHMPDGRPGNVISRPPLRDYEICFLGDSGVEEQSRIDIRDLHVFVEGGQVKLWSKSLARQIVPRLSSAHNYTSRSLGIYKFLCDLQNQNVELPLFELPSQIRWMAHVPRIMLDDFILSPRQWNIPKERLQSLIKQGVLQETQWNGLREDFDLPDRVSYAEMDNVLVIDLQNPALVEILLDESRFTDRVRLTEYIPDTLESFVRSVDGTQDFAHEIMLPFFNADAKPFTTALKNPSEHLASTARRRFPPGTEWLSLKLYGARSSTENVLVKRIVPFLEEYKKSGAVRKWFFIRYGDPDWHVRLRILGDPETLHGTLLPGLGALLEPEVTSGLIHQLETFTYVRETERYGGSKAIELIENLFMEDSRFVASALSATRADGDARWRGAIVGVDALMTAFGYDSAQKFMLIDQLRHAFGREFNETKSLRKQLGDRFRRYRDTIILDLGGPYADDSGDAEAARLRRYASEYVRAIKSVVTELNRLALTQELSRSVAQILQSLLHMQCNRMFKADGRAEEFVVYDLLRRHYLAMNQQSAQENPSARAAIHV